MNTHTLLLSNIKKNIIGDRIEGTNDINKVFKETGIDINKIDDYLHTLELAGMVKYSKNIIKITDMGNLISEVF